MKKGKVTKEMIIERSAAIFNSRGYFGASISDVMAATGLEKGGIYHHFTSKDELALAAFDYVISINGRRLMDAINAQETATKKLLALVESFAQLVSEPSVQGGCPLMNCAVESDDTHPILRKKVRTAMKRLLSLVASIIQSGIDSGELNNHAEAEQLSIFLIASIEGGMMLSKLYEDPNRMTAVTSNLKKFIDSCSNTKLADC